MHSRSDQVQAHSFMTARVVSALVSAEPDAPSPPLRRTPLGFVIGLMVAILIVAGFAVYGILKPGGATAWTQPGKLIVENETGGQYVLADGILRPVQNFASAKLLLGEKMTVARTPSSSLAGVPRGTPIGIVGAPDALPANTPGRDLSWLTCATSTRDASGASHPVLKVTVGGAADVVAADEDQAVLVRSAGGGEYLVWRGTRMRLAAPWVAAVLGYDGLKALPVRDSWINAIPAGPDLAPVPVAGLGSPGPVLGGQPTKVGQVFQVDVVGRRPAFYLLTGSGLMQVNQTAAALALGNPGVATGGKARELAPAAMAAVAAVASPDTMANLPDEPPALMAFEDGQGPCVLAEPGAGDVRTTLVKATVDNGVVVGGPGLVRDEFTADRIEVKPGAGMLARTLPAPGTPGMGLYLVTDAGAKFPVPNEKAATALGYRVSDAVALPAELLSLLPTGPVLSPENAAGGGAPPAP
ncbi:type VII secretion protein EccB [Saccharopolyspora sp. NPDC003752]